MSAGLLEFQIVDGRNQIEPKPEAFATISIAFTQDAKDFQFAQDVFNYNPLARQCSIASFLVRAQRMKFRFLGRRVAVGMNFGQSLITGICQSTCLNGHRTATILEQLKVVFAAMTKACR